MPRSKPSKTEEVRITLGNKEREILGDLVGSIQFKNTATPIVNLLNDLTGTATVALLLGYVFPNFLINNLTGQPYTREDFEGKSDKGIFDYIEAQNLAAIAATGALAYFTGGLSLGTSAIVGGIFGTVAAEGAEEVISDARGAANAARRQAELVKLYFTLTDPTRGTN